MRHVLAAWLGVVLLAAAATPPVLATADDRTHIAVVIASGDPMVAALSWRPGKGADAGAFIVRVADGRGTASGWAANLETHGSFRIVGAVGTVTAVPAPGVITVIQGNRSLGGHTLVRYRTVAPSDAIRWTVARYFGDGEYQLAVPGSPVMQSSGRATVVLTVSGGAP